MASLRASGNRNALHLEYTKHIEKNIVPLKEVLTHQSRDANSVDRDNDALHRNQDTAPSTLAIVKFAENACTVDVFAICR
jgi:hypothetical protein